MHISSSAAVYVISVAADLAGMHPQTLRQYDRLGLVGHVGAATALSRAGSAQRARESCV